MPRPTKLTARHIRDVEQAMQLGLTYALASGYIGIGESTMYAWLARGREQPKSMYGKFREALKRGQAKAAAVNLAHIQRAADDGSWQAAAWILERRFGYQKAANLHIDDHTEQTTADEHAADDELAAVLAMIPRGAE